jgi:proline dehydrogenase
MWLLDRSASMQPSVRDLGWDERLEPVIVDEDYVLSPNIGLNSQQLVASLFFLISNTTILHFITRKIARNKF